MALGACIVTGIVGGLVYISSGTIIRWIPARVVLALITFLIPLAPREVLGNTANLHWYFLWLAPWLLLYRPTSRAASWVIGIAAFFATVTEIQMALFIPLMLWQRGDSRRAPIRALYLLGVVLQVVATLIAPRGSSGAHAVDLASLGYGYLINCVMTIVSANPVVLGPLILGFGPFVGLLILVPFIGLAIYAIRRGSQLQKIMAATLVFGSVALYVVAVEISPGIFYDYAAMSKVQLAVPWLARYGVVPSMFLLALIPLAVVVSRRGNAVDTRRASPVLLHAARTGSILERFTRDGFRFAVLLILLAVMVASFTPASTRRSNGPQWQPQVARQEARCVGLSPSAQVSLTGAPSAGWKLSVTCTQLGRP
jgi:hypothetical protein